MGFSLRIEEDDAELIISTMADALRAANKDADKYHDMNEQTGSERYHQISVLTRILSRQSDDVIANVITDLRKEVEGFKSKSGAEKDGAKAVLDMIDIMKDHSTEDAKSLLFEEELCKILAENKAGE